jgi:hypothetical protein
MSLLPPLDAAFYILVCPIPSVLSVIEGVTVKGHLKLLEVPHAALNLQFDSFYEAPLKLAVRKLKDLHQISDATAFFVALTAVKKTTVD